MPSTGAVTLPLRLLSVFTCFTRANVESVNAIAKWKTCPDELYKRARMRAIAKVSRFTALLFAVATSC